MTPAVPAGTVPADLQWGITINSRRRRWLGSIRRGVPATFASAALLLGLLLGLSSTAMASTSPARADILGISSTVQDWICGIVSPEEPWQGVGDGPESWMSNRNLANIKPGAVKVVSANATISAVPATSTTAPDTMDQLSSIPAGSYTLYEIAGLRGLSWWTIPLNIDGSRNCSLWNYLWTQGGNLVATVKNDFLQVIISIKEASSADNPLSFLYDASGGVMSTIFSLVFVPIATLMLLLSALWLGIQSARGKDGIRAAMSVVGATVALVAIGAFMYLQVNSDHHNTNGFRRVAQIVDQAISTANAIATNGMFDALTSHSSGDCALPADNTSAARGQRITSCILADTLAYRPWAIGQFGGAGANPIPLPAGWTAVMPDAKGVISATQLKGQKTLPCYVDFNKCTDLRTYLIAQHGGIQVGGELNAHQGYLVCSSATTISITIDAGWLGSVIPSIGALDKTFTIDTSSVCSPMFRVFIVLANTNPSVAAAYSGDVGIARMSQAFSSLIGVGVAGVPVLIIALLTMIWTAMTFVQYLTGAFKLPYAVYAGKIKMAKEWAGDLVYTWSARLAYGLVLNIAILIIVWVLSSSMSFGLQLVWLAIILFSFFKMIQKVQELIRPGVASMRADPIKAAGTVARQARRRSVDGYDGARERVLRRKALASDPTRGKVRRTVSTLGAPISLITGGIRGAATGTSGADRRNRKAILAAVGGGPRPGNGRPPVVPGSQRRPAPNKKSAATTTASTTEKDRTPRKAGTAHPGAVLVRDVTTRRTKAPAVVAPATAPARKAASARKDVTKAAKADPIIRKRTPPPPRPLPAVPAGPAEHPTEQFAPVFGRHASDSPTEQVRRPVPESTPDADARVATKPAKTPAPQAAPPAPVEREKPRAKPPIRQKPAGPSTGDTTPRTVKTATKPKASTPRRVAEGTTQE